MMLCMMTDFPVPRFPSTRMVLVGFSVVTSHRWIRNLRLAMSIWGRLFPLSLRAQGLMVEPAPHPPRRTQPRQHMCGHVVAGKVAKRGVCVPTHWLHRSS